MTIQIVLATTAFGLATVTAAYESGTLHRCERRVLVVACTTAMPEATRPMSAVAGVPDLMDRFDAVFDYNAYIAPQHPSTWHPRRADLPLWERHFRQLWGLGDDDLHLVVESIQVNPAQALCRIFGDARIDVYADGLMSYQPEPSYRTSSPAGLSDCSISIWCRVLRRCCSTNTAYPAPLFLPRAFGPYPRP